MKKIFILFCGTFLLMGCQKFNIRSSVLPEGEYCKAPEFNTLIVSGNATVKLVNGNYSVRLLKIGKKSLLCPAKLKEHTLKISGSHHGAIAEVGVPSLKKLIVINNATVTAQDFKTTALTVIAHDHSNIDLSGELDIKKIIQESSGRINIGWVNSYDLRVHGKNRGIISLAGRTNKLHVDIHDHSALYARYLRTQQARVFTDSHAVVEVWTLNSLQATAHGKSNIYYYNKPEDLSIVTKEMGNVLYPYDIR